jgi:hypothetical protein
MGVDLRRRDVGVAEEHLDGAKIGAAFEEMGGKSVAQHVRADPLGRDAGVGSEPLMIWWRRTRLKCFLPEGKRKSESRGT